MQCVADAIGLWPSFDAFCQDVGVRPGTARVWKHRRSIPAEWWCAVERAAGARGISGASASDLARVWAEQVARGRSLSAPREAA